MAAKLSLLSTSIPCAVFLLLAAAAPPAAAGPPASAVENSTEFIRSRCGATRYPGLCYTSLAGYSSAVRQSPVQLARLAANLTVSRLTSLSNRVASLRHSCAKGGPCPEAGALRDCADVLGDASELARQTAGELWGLQEAAGSPDSSWRVSNAQTWMSAALSDEETCADGFEEFEDASRTKSDVIWRLKRVKQYTSNALALVNGIVGGT